MGYALGAIERACAASSNMGEATHVASWSLSAGLAGVEHEDIKPFLAAASLAQRYRGDDLAAFDVMGEEGRDLARTCVPWPPEADPIVEYLDGPNFDPERLDQLMKGVDARVLSGMQLVMESVIVQKYRESLERTEAGLDAVNESAKSAWQAFWYLAKKIANWTAQRWGRAFCFGVGGLMVLSGFDSYNSNIQTIAGGAALLITGLGLTAIRKIRQSA